MKAHSPAFQFYPKDWFSDANVRSMSYEEKGIYIELILTCWIEGSIPWDFRKLCGFSSGDTRGISWELIRGCFDPHPDNPQRLIHPRVEKEREVQREYREQRRQAGLASANKRRQHPLTSVASPLERDSQRNPTPLSSSPLTDQHNSPSDPFPGTAVTTSPSMDGKAGCVGVPKDRRAEIQRLTKKAASRRKAP